jgi:hypothetical protein
MAYQIKKRGKLWRIIWVDWSGKKRTWKHIPKEQWGTLGFNSNMSYDEARAFAKSINLSNYDKSLERRKQASVERIRTESDAAIQYLPLAEKFEAEVLASHNNQKTKSVWRAVKRIIISVRLEPNRWRRNSITLYQEFQSRNYSRAYVKKLIGVMNMYGNWLYDLTERPYVPVPSPKGRERERIVDSHYDSNKKSLEALPLNPTLLSKLKQEMDEPMCNFMHIALWLGLRPIEIDQSRLGMKYFAVTEEDGFTVVNIYQSKLTSVPRDKRWKKIPIIFKEQSYALEILNCRNFKRPLTKTIQRILGPGFNNYSGRKGFELLMRGLGRSFPEVSSWLGHRNINTSWKHYTDRKTVFVEKK